jgi:maltooligosyltrehalose trehalohydrolase
MASTWQLEMGAQPADGGRVRFRVWAPAARAVEVELYPWPGGIARHAMSSESGGVWSATVEAHDGILYRYRLDEHWGFPDPYSRAQPEGVHGPSQVVDPRAFHWSDGGWRGLDRDALVLYEVHVGAYTPAGTFDAIIERLNALRDLGVTALELMPVAEFPGLRNWGYDAAAIFAPCSAYGGPDGLRRLVDAAHARGLGVVLDVVYNHRAADGDYLPAFSDDYYTDRYDTPWGHAVNFDGPNNAWVRRYYLDNARYWLHEFHIDGLRLDATHQMHDASPKHILQELAEVAHEARPERCFLLLAEDDRRDPRLVLPPSAGGHGLDALWVDDLHHSVYVLITGDRGHYHGSYEGTTDELARLFNAGALYSTTLGHQAASLASIEPWRLINCLENHDQVGNDPRGRRLWQQFGLEACKSAYALLLFAPGTPLLFMGDEFAASTPFLYFTDLRPELIEAAKAGRSQEFRHFWQESGAHPPRVADAQVEETFQRSRLEWEERLRPPHDAVLRLFGELLRLRRDDPVLRAQSRDRLRAAPVAKDVLAVERWNGEGERRLLLVNFGAAARVEYGADAWRPLLCTGEARFAGPGVELDTLALRPVSAIELPAECAVVYAQG